jgi:hypothetical protein
MTVNRIEKVFPDELLKEVTTLIDTVPWKYGWNSNKSIEFTHWNHSFAKASAINTLDVSHQLSGTILAAWNHIQANIIGPQSLLRCYTNSHTFGVEGYPHVDSKREEDKTIVVYMNKHWQRDWGGETTIYNGNEIAHAELPKYNQGLSFSGNQWHSARSVTRICPAQRITLMFKYAPHNLDPVRDRLQIFLTAIGAEKIKHSGRNLFTHLLNTYDILKAQGYDQDTCSAGGLHSIFGTNIFTSQTLGKDQRDIVVNVIGEEATKLVDLFSELDRPKCLEYALSLNITSLITRTGSILTLSENQLNSICAIEAANLSDQKSLSKFTHLKKYIK